MRGFIILTEENLRNIRKEIRKNNANFETLITKRSLLQRVLENIKLSLKKEKLKFNDIKNEYQRIKASTVDLMNEISNKLQEP